MIQNRPRGIPSSATRHMNNAFAEIEKYTVNYVDTQDLVSQLIIRMGDWFEDPDPSYDEFFQKSNQESLEMVFNALRRCNMDQVKEK
jgi:hypothetical protein